MKTLILATLIGSPAFAVTVPLYTPGGSPCAGACTLEWAQEQAGVPEGEPVFMTAPAGSYVEWMSYAKDGTPYGTQKTMVLADDETGQGYWFRDEQGDLKLMFKLDECQNWAVLRTGSPPERLPPSTTILTPVNDWPEWETPTATTWSFDPDDDPDDCCTTYEPPTPPAPIPLPPAFLFLALALASLFGIRLMGDARKD